MPYASNKGTDQSVYPHYMIKVHLNRFEMMLVPISLGRDFGKSVSQSWVLLPT